MFIQCPHCRTLNDSDDADRRKTPDLRCSHCGARLYAERRPTESDIGHDHRTETAGAAVVELPADTVEAAAVDPIGRPRSRSLPWIGANLLMIVLFVAQYSYFFRDRLAEHQALRPWLEFLCHYTGCEIPLQEDIDRIKIVARNVFTHPRTDNALLINVTMENKAPFIQAYPRLEVSFFDLNQSLLASRVFDAREYLPPDFDPVAGMPPGTPIQSILEVVDPGSEAINFTFRIIPSR